MIYKASTTELTRDLQGKYGSNTFLNTSGDLGEAARVVWLHNVPTLKKYDTYLFWERLLNDYVFNLLNSIVMYLYY